MTAELELILHVIESNTYISSVTSGYVTAYTTLQGRAHHTTARLSIEPLNPSSVHGDNTATLDSELLASSSASAEFRGAKIV